MSRQDVAIDLQREFWNEWNSSTREQRLGEREIRQAQVVSNWLSELGNRDLDIIDVGCGAGWFCPELVQFGRVTATDLSDKVLERAKRRVPAAKFVAGDFMILDFGVEAFDVAVSLKCLRMYRIRLRS